MKPSSVVVSTSVCGSICNCLTVGAVALFAGAAFISLVWLLRDGSIPFFHLKGVGVARLLTLRAILSVVYERVTRLP